MPQLLCIQLEDPKNCTSQALRRSRAVIHLLPASQPALGAWSRDRLLHGSDSGADEAVAGQIGQEPRGWVACGADIVKLVKYSGVMLSVNKKHLLDVIH